MKWLNKKWFKIFLLVFSIVLLILPIHFSKADVLGIGSITTDAITTVVDYILGLAMSMILTFIHWLSELLEYFIRNQPAIINQPVVYASWTILRDFVNMFFILILIVMAFGTIFSIRNYTWSDMMGRFLIVAVFINFSYTIGMLVVGFGDSLAGAFLKNINNLGPTLIQGLSLSKVIVNNPDALKISFAAPAPSGVGLIVSHFAVVIILAVSLFSIAASVFFVVVRIPIIWFLLILSPLAWMGLTVPSMKQFAWSRWWKNLWAWSFFLPIYLLFLTFGLGFIATGQDRLAQFNAPPSNSSIVNWFFSVFGAGTVLMYVVTIAFMLGGIWAGLSLSSMIGKGTSPYFDWMNKKFKAVVKGKYAPGAGYVEAGYKGAKEGVEARIERIKEKGIPGLVMGEEKKRLAQAGVAEKFGGEALAGRSSKQMLDEIDKQKSRLEKLRLDRQQLEDRLDTAKGTERTALLRMRAENGWMRPSDANAITNTLRDLGGGKTIAGRAFIESLNKGKFNEMATSTAEKEILFNQFAQDPELQKSFGKLMADSKEVFSKDIANKLIDLYTNESAEIRKKAHDAIKANINNFAKKTADRENIVVNVNENETLRKLTAQIMADKGEVSDWGFREGTIGLFGGRDAQGNIQTEEGRAINKTIEEKNRIFNLEGAYRSRNGIRDNSQILNITQQQDLENSIMQDMLDGTITSLTSEEVNTPEIHNALNTLLNMPRGTRITNIRTGAQTTPAKIIKSVVGKMDRKKREALERARRFRINYTP